MNHFSNRLNIVDEEIDNDTEDEFQKNKTDNTNSKRRGFTLIEVLIVIGIISILATVVLVAINPARQFKQARDTQRVSNVNAILNAVSQNIAENRGELVCDGVVSVIPSDEIIIASSDGFDLAPCVVPNYISSLPYDPGSTNYVYMSTNDYNTGYYISKDGDDRVKVKAVGDLSSEISVIR